MARKPKVKTPTLRAAAEASATTLAPVVGIDPATVAIILSTLFTLLTRLCPGKSVESQVATVTKAYNATSDSYEPKLQGRFEVAARKALRREKVKRPTQAQIRAFAKAALDKVRLSPPELVAVCCGEIEGNPDTEIIVAECG